MRMRARHTCTDRHCVCGFSPNILSLPLKLVHSCDSHSCLTTFKATKPSLPAFFPDHTVCCVTVGCALSVKTEQSAQFLWPDAKRSVQGFPDEMIRVQASCQDTTPLLSHALMGPDWLLCMTDLHFRCARWENASCMGNTPRHCFENSTQLSVTRQPPLTWSCFTTVLMSRTAKLPPAFRVAALRALLRALYSLILTYTGMVQGWRMLGSPDVVWGMVVVQSGTGFPSCVYIHVSCPPHVSQLLPSMPAHSCLSATCVAITRCGWQWLFHGSSK